LQVPGTSRFRISTVLETVHYCAELDLSCSWYCKLTSITCVVGAGGVGARASGRDIRADRLLLLHRLVLLWSHNGFTTCAASHAEKQAPTIQGECVLSLLVIYRWTSLLFLCHLWKNRHQPYKVSKLSTLSTFFGCQYLC